MAVEQNNNTDSSSDSSQDIFTSIYHMLIVRIQILRSEAALSARGKGHFRLYVNFKFPKKSDFSSECCYKLKLKLLFVQFVLNKLAHEHVTL